MKGLAGLRIHEAVMNSCGQALADAPPGTWPQLQEQRERRERDREHTRPAPARGQREVEREIRRGR
jgi:hypothetical protein